MQEPLSGHPAADAWHTDQASGGGFTAAAGALGAGQSAVGPVTVRSTDDYGIGQRG